MGCIFSKKAADESRCESGILIMNTQTLTTNNNKSTKKLCSSAMDKKRQHSLLALLKHGRKGMKSIKIDTCDHENNNNIITHELQTKSTPSANPTQVDSQRKKRKSTQTSTTTIMTTSDSTLSRNASSSTNTPPPPEAFSSFTAHQSNPINVHQQQQQQHPYIDDDGCGCVDVKDEVLLFTSVRKLCSDIIANNLLANKSLQQQQQQNTKSTGKLLCLFMFGCQGSSKGELAFELVQHSPLLKTLNSSHSPSINKHHQSKSNCPLFYHIDAAAIIVANIDARIREYNQLVAQTMKNRKKQLARLNARRLQVQGTDNNNSNKQLGKVDEEEFDDDDKDKQEVGENDEITSSSTDDDDDDEVQPDDDTQEEGEKKRVDSTSVQVTASLQATDDFDLITLSTKQRSILQLKLLKYFNSVTSKWLLGLIQMEVEKLEARVRAKYQANNWCMNSDKNSHNPTPNRVYLINLVPNQLSLFKSCLYLQQELLIKEFKYPFWAIRFERRTNIKLLTKERANVNKLNANGNSNTTSNGAKIIPIKIRFPTILNNSNWIMSSSSSPSSQAAHLELRSLEKVGDKQTGEQQQKKNLAAVLATDVLVNGINEKLGPKFNDNFSQQFKAMNKLTQVRYNQTRDYNYAQKKEVDEENDTDVNDDDDDDDETSDGSGESDCEEQSNTTSTSKDRQLEEVKSVKSWCDERSSGGHERHLVPHVITKSVDDIERTKSDENLTHNNNNMDNNNNNNNCSSYKHLAPNNHHQRLSLTTTTSSLTLSNNNNIDDNNSDCPQSVVSLDSAPKKQVLTSQVSSSLLLLSSTHSFNSSSQGLTSAGEDDDDGNDEKDERNNGARINSLVHQQQNTRGHSIDLQQPSQVSASTLTHRLSRSIPIAVELELYDSSIKSCENDNSTTSVIDYNEQQQFLLAKTKQHKQDDSTTSPLPTRLKWRHQQEQHHGAHQLHHGAEVHTDIQEQQHLNAGSCVFYHKPKWSSRAKTTKSPLMGLNPSQHRSSSSTYQLVPVRVAYANHQSQLMLEVKRVHSRSLKFKTYSDFVRLMKLIEKVRRQLSADCDTWLYDAIAKQHQISKENTTDSLAFHALSTPVNSHNNVNETCRHQYHHHHQHQQHQHRLYSQQPALIVYTLRVDVCRISTGQFHYPSNLQPIIADLMPPVNLGNKSEFCCDEKKENALDKISSVVKQSQHNNHNLQAVVSQTKRPLVPILKTRRNSVSISDTDRPLSASINQKTLQVSPCLYPIIDRQLRPTSSPNVQVTQNKSQGAAGVKRCKRHVRFKLNQAPNACDEHDRLRCKLRDQLTNLPAQHRQWIHSTLFVSASSEKQTIKLMPLVTTLVKLTASFSKTTQTKVFAANVNSSS